MKQTNELDRVTKKPIPDFISHQRITRSIENQLRKQILEYDSYPWFQIVITYPDDDFGFLFPEDKLPDPYNLASVKQTHRHIKRILREHFKVPMSHFFIERHQGKQHVYHQGKHLQYDDIKDNGRFHSHIMMTDIDENLLLEPHCKLARLWDENGHMDLPIKNIQYTDINMLKIDLINAALKKADWIPNNDYNLHSKPVKIDILDDSEDVKRVLHYNLKECYNKGTDFTQVIDWDNSDFDR